MLCGDLNGKEIPKRREFIHPSIYLPFYIFTYVYLIHFYVRQKLIQHCKATPLQYTLIKRKKFKDKESIKIIS